MQLERFNARNATKFARPSGISVKRFDERSSECKVFANGARLLRGIEVRELSVRLKCLRNLHFNGEIAPVSRRFEVLPALQGAVEGPIECTLEVELPEPDLFTFVLLVLICRYGVSCFELVGRLGDVLELRASRNNPFRGLTLWPSWSSPPGEFGGEMVFAESMRRIGGANGQASTGELWALDDRRRLLSMSSSTIFIKISVGSSTLARFNVSERSCSANLSHP